MAQQSDPSLVMSAEQHRRMFWEMVFSAVLSSGVASSIAQSAQIADRALDVWETRWIVSNKP